MDLIFILMLLILVIFGTWLIKISLHNRKVAFIAWLLSTAGTPFIAAILWTSIKSHIYSEIASEIIESYFKAVTEPIVSNLPLVLITIFIGLNLAITLIAVTSSDDRSPAQ